MLPVPSEENFPSEFRSAPGQMTGSYSPRFTEATPVIVPLTWGSPGESAVDVLAQLTAR